MFTADESAVSEQVFGRCEKIHYFHQRRRTVPDVPVRPEKAVSGLQPNDTFDLYPGPGHGSSAGVFFIVGVAGHEEEMRDSFTWTGSAEYRAE